MPPADIGSKRLISLAPNAWVQWVMQRSDVVAQDIITSDFQWVSRESDVLVQAASLQDGTFLILNELQLRYDPRMPRRMQAYAALAEERYDLPVYPVLVNILPPPAGVLVSDRYESTFLGLQARRDYRVLNLWEVDADIALQQPVPALIPFVPMLRGGDEEAVVRRALHMLRANTQMRDLEPLLAFFASFVLDTQLVQHIMRWDMVVLEQSPWYQEIVARGRQEGLELVRRQLLRTLQYRFGQVPPELVDRLQELTLEQLDPLAEAALTVDSLTAFQAQLSTAGEGAPSSTP